MQWRTTCRTCPLWALMAAGGGGYGFSGSCVCSPEVFLVCGKRGAMAREYGSKITALQSSWGGVTSGGDLLQIPSLKNPCKQFKNSPKFFPACLPIPSTSCAMTETVVDSRSVSLDVSCWLWSAAVPNPACLPLCPSQAECQGFPALRGNFLGSRPHFHLVFQRKGML